MAYGAESPLNFPTTPPLHTHTHTHIRGGVEGEGTTTSVETEDTCDVLAEENLKEREHLEDRGVDGRIILK